MESNQEQEVMIVRTMTDEERERYGVSYNKDEVAIKKRGARLTNDSDIKRKAKSPCRKCNWNVKGCHDNCGEFKKFKESLS